MDLSYILTDYVTLILLITFVIAFVSLSLHYGLIFMKVGRKGRTKKELREQLEAKNHEKSDSELPGVSIVMVAQNEGRFLRDNLVYLLEQDYPKFEVIVVDYKSTDDTKFVMQVCEQNYENLKTVSMPEDVNMFQGKKLPLSIGIKSARYDTLVLIEPDCKPVGFDWLREMVKGYARQDTKIVLGYCGVKREKGFFNLVQQYDNLEYSANYLASAFSHQTYTGTGKNLSYSKKYFFERGAFTHHYTHEFGADDLFVNQNATEKNTAVVLTPESRVEMEPKKSMKSWRLRRLQREATFRLHPMAERIRRGIYPLSVLVFYGAMAALLAVMFPWYLVVGVLALKLAWQIMAMYVLGSQFGVKSVAWTSPLLEIYFWFENNILAISSLIRRNR